MKPPGLDTGHCGVGSEFESFLDEEGIKDRVLERTEEKLAHVLDGLARRIGLAADKIWEVGKSWEHFPDSFGDDMKALSDSLHGVRREFERATDCSVDRVCETVVRQLGAIDREVLWARGHTGGPSGQLLQEAHEIIAAIVDELKSE